MTGKEGVEIDKDVEVMVRSMTDREVMVTGYDEILRMECQSQSSRQVRLSAPSSGHTHEVVTNVWVTGYEDRVVAVVVTAAGVVVAVAVAVAVVGTRLVTVSEDVYVTSRVEMAVVVTPYDVVKTEV